MNLLKYLVISSLLSLLTVSSWAGNLRQPNPVDDTAVFDYFLHIKDNFNSLPVTTTNPDGTKPGRVGDMVLFNDSGTFSLHICTDAANSTWQEI